MKKITNYTLVLFLLAILMSSCTNKATVYISSLNTTEQQLFSAMVAERLNDFGINSTVNSNFSNIQEIEQAILQGSVDVAPIFLQDSIAGFNSISTAPIEDFTLATEIFGDTMQGIFDMNFTTLFEIDNNFTIFVSNELLNNGEFAISRFLTDSFSLTTTENFVNSAIGLDFLYINYNFNEFSIINIVDNNIKMEEPTTDILIIDVLNRNIIDSIEGYTNISALNTIFPRNTLNLVSSHRLSSENPKARAAVNSVMSTIDVPAFTRAVDDINKGTMTIEEAVEKVRNN